ncbi:hypothetical protein L3X38_029567 [Prunus dulcis]|uniref:Uncharacterized protein n=1 Tax=Prunus dulcis TaxID=3755 RepID=A0AAD4VTF1_PRUDU|nr:hypothetical protein L3X38_029567 [Prunus dulcis]
MQLRSRASRDQTPLSLCSGKQLVCNGGDKPYLHCRQAALWSTNSTESFSRAMSPTYAHRRQASPPLQTSCSPEQKFNGVFFKSYVLTYAHRQQASPSLQTSCSSEHKLNGVIVMRYVPGIHTHATSFLSIAGKLLHKYKLNGVFFKCYVFQVLCLRTHTYKIQ